MLTTPETAPQLPKIHLDERFVTPEVKALIGVDPDVNPGFLDPTPRPKSTVESADPNFVNDADAKAAAERHADRLAELKANDAHLRFLNAQKASRELARTGFRNLVETSVDKSNPRPNLGTSRTSAGYTRNPKQR